MRACGCWSHREDHLRRRKLSLSSTDGTSEHRVSSHRKLSVKSRATSLYLVMFIVFSDPAQNRGSQVVLRDARSMMYFIIRKSFRHPAGGYSGMFPRRASAKPTRKRSARCLHGVVNRRIRESGKLYTHQRHFINVPSFNYCTLTRSVSPLSNRVAARLRLQIVTRYRNFD